MSFDRVAACTIYQAWQPNVNATVTRFSRVNWRVRSSTYNCSSVNGMPLNRRSTHAKCIKASVMSSLSSRKS